MFETMWTVKCQSLTCLLDMFKKLWYFNNIHVVKILQEILWYKIPSDPRVMYLGLIPEGIIWKEDSYLFRILIIAGKKAITRNWFKPDHSWTGSVDGHYPQVSTTLWCFARCFYYEIDKTIAICQSFIMISTNYSVFQVNTHHINGYVLL